MPLTTVDQGLLSTNAQYTGFKNRLINGGMVIDQRNNGASVTVNSTAQTFSVDRWWASGQSTDGVFTMAQSTNTPTGFNNSLQNTVATADASIGATQRYYIAQRIEAFNTADLGWGTANAQAVTLSFWVRSSVTGTFGGFIYNANADYSYPFSYAISVADTWEYKTVVISGPTAGTWLGATNGIGMQIGWSFGAGVDRLGTAGSWAASQYFGATGQTNLIGTLNATFYITGVQLEKGSTATSFDYRPYGTELVLCQRYYQVAANGINGSGNSGSPYGAGGGLYVPWIFPVTLRVAPSIVSSAAGTWRARKGDLTTFNGFIAFQSASTTSATLITATLSGSTVGSYYWIEPDTSGAYLAFSAEL